MFPPARVSRAITRHRPTYSDTKPLASSKRRRWRTRTVARRLRDPQLAGRLRHLSGCRRGRPWYCFASLNATRKMTLTDGTELAPALGIGAFAEKTLVAAGQRASSNVGCTSSSTSPHSEVMCRSTAELGQRLAELRARSPAQFPRGCERICERNAVQWARRRGIRCDGVDGRLLVTCEFETREATGDGDRLAHNPEVAGSNPVPATSENGPRRHLRGPFYARWTRIWTH